MSAPTALTAQDVAVHHPTTHGPDATVGEVRAFLRGQHVHLALVVAADGRLLATLTRDDLAEAGAASPAVTVGRLDGRTVAASTPADDLPSLLMSLGARRVAVVDDEGVLVGLVCRKRSGEGFCSDAGIRDKRADRTTSA